MAITTTKALTWAPAAANGVSVTASTTAWVNSSWVQLIASTSGAIQLQSIAMAPGTSAVEYEVDIGKGAAGSEVVVGTQRGTMQGTTADDTAPRFGIVIDNIPTGTRVAVRMRKQGIAADVWMFAVGYYTGTDSTNTTSNAQLVVPSAADGIAVTPSGTAWVNSSYVQFTAGFANATWLCAIAFNHNGSTSAEFEVDLATGGAGTEVVITTLRTSTRNVSTVSNCLIYLANPLQVSASTRISMRLRKAGVTTATWNFALMYYTQQAEAFTWQQLTHPNQPYLEKNEVIGY